MSDRMEFPPYIWIAPACNGVECYGERPWCDTPDELTCEECKGKPGAYVRAGKDTAALVSDLAAARARIETLEASVAHYKAQDFSLVAETCRLNEQIAELERLDREAATHVESLIVMRTTFTGEPPYVGWKGLGLALMEHLDKQDDRIAALTTVTEDDVEAVAETLQKDSIVGLLGRAWDQITETSREAWRKEARGALSVFVARKGSAQPEPDADAGGQSKSE